MGDETRQPRRGAMTGGYRSFANYGTTVRGRSATTLPAGRVRADDDTLNPPEPRTRRAAGAHAEPLGGRGPTTVAGKVGQPKVAGNAGAEPLGGRGQPKVPGKVVSPGENRRARHARIATGITSAVAGVGHGWVDSSAPCGGGAVQRLPQSSADSPDNRYVTLLFLSLRQHYCSVL